ncbi:MULTISPECIES: hypothetical protein [unclassified Acinetobacter]|uniref:hypothetical protein n=1 Tax=unclassified Acinetobacter TaxID=196816 RepID=UPI0015D237CF|nr:MULTISPECIES: hypothetical protein [unclassified Acinetobacter]UUS62550.1 hypothetical protein MST17_16710 [Acinetobacter sp. YH16056_T]
MSALSNEFLIPLKVVNARSQHIKLNLNGLLKKIEKRAIDYVKKNIKIDSIVTWDDWIYAALDCFQPGWAKTLEVGSPIPQDLLNRLPCSTGELVSIGSWMLSKNIYRFENEVAAELVKSEFKGKLPSFLVNIKDLCIYVQTDNFDLSFENSQIVGVIFSVNELCYEKVLISTLFLDTGVTRTIVSLVNENQDIEDCLTDFIDKFHDDRAILDQNEIDAYQTLQKKLINILLWFSQTVPDYFPLVPENHQEKTGVKTVKKELRLFEASKYKPFLAGKETKKVISDLYKNFENIEENKNIIRKTSAKRPHLRRAHYHLYWYGKKGAYERHEFKWIPITIVGG